MPQGLGSCLLAYLGPPETCPEEAVRIPLRGFLSGGSDFWGSFQGFLFGGSSPDSFEGSVKGSFKV